MNFKITLLLGDGVGPEVVGEAVRVLETIAGKYKHSFDFQERLMGGCSIDKSVAFLKALQTEFGVDLFDRMRPGQRECSAGNLDQQGSTCQA